MGMMPKTNWVSMICQWKLKFPAHTPGGNEEFFSWHTTQCSIKSSQCYSRKANSVCDLVEDLTLLCQWPSLLPITSGSQSQNRLWSITFPQHSILIVNVMYEILSAHFYLDRHWFGVSTNITLIKHDYPVSVLSIFIYLILRIMPRGKDAIVTDNFTI